MICRDGVRAVIGDKFSDEQIDDMIARLAARAKRKGLGLPDAEQNKALREAAQEITAGELKQRIITKRAEAFAETARLKRQEFYGKNIDDFSKRLQEMNVGSSRVQGSSALSVDAKSRALEDAWRGALISDLRKIDGAIEALHDGWGNGDKDLEREIVREMARINGFKSNPSENHLATQIAQVFVNHQNIHHDALNSVGAYIGKLEGYITKQNHDTFKVAGKFIGSGKNEMQKWIDRIIPALDENKVFEKVDEFTLADIQKRMEGAGSDINQLAKSDIDAELNYARQNFMENVWKDIVLGQGGTAEANDLNAVSLPAGLANKLSKERVLHFKGPDEWYDYHNDMGVGSFLETYLHNVHSMAKQKVMLETWGPNPRAAFEADIERLGKIARDANNIKATEKITSPMRVREFEAVDGSAARPMGLDEKRAATIFQGYRTWQSISKLGGMVVSSISDMGSASTALVRAGAPLFETYSDIIKSILHLQPKEQKQIAEDIGAVSRVMAGQMASNFASPDIGVQGLKKAQEFFYRVNGFNAWQNGMRTGVSTVIAKILGRNSDIVFDKLSKGVRQELTRYGIDAKLWDLVRIHGEELDNTGKIILPDMARKINPDEAVLWHGVPKQLDNETIFQRRIDLKSAFQKIGEPEQFETWRNMTDEARDELSKLGVNEKAWLAIRERGLDHVTNRALSQYLNIPEIHTEAQKKAAVDEAHLRLQSYFTSLIDDALTEPRAYEKMILTAGTRDGTTLGIMTRLITQFKSFPLTMVTRNLYRTGHEAVTTLGAVMRGEESFGELGRPAMMIANTMVGMTVLGYISNAMSDILAGKEPLPVDHPETWARAFTRGGGAGFLGDVLFAEARRNQSIWAALGGPTVGTAEQIFSIAKNLREGNFDDVGGDVWDVAKGNIPFANLFYLKAALNYALLYQMQEMASPGYLARMQERMQDNEGRGFLIEPPQMQESQMNQ